MRRRWARHHHSLQAKAILLLAVFLSAGSSLPGLDALVYHSGAGEVSRSQAHVEPAGGCLNHAEHCTLGRAAPGSGAARAAAGAPQVALLCTPTPRPFVTQAGSGTHRLTLAQPRAPPILRFV